MKPVIKILLLAFFIQMTAELNAQSFTNPILAGFYPDPSICRVDDDYYIVNSSFAYYPGLPIFHSKDLLNWQQVGYAMNRPEQLNLDGAGVSRGLFAPAIRYNNGVYYIVCTQVDAINNFVITAKNPKGPWSNPVQLPQVNGIDPSLFFDADKAYIIYNSIPPNDISLYDGHRTIRMYEFDVKNLNVVGEEKLLVNGGTDISKKPVWIEGPHLLKKDGWYYLICAEGGTERNHSEVVFRSKSLDEPFVSYDKNPILTQRNLNPDRKNPVTNTGHADFVEDKNGNWWAVFLGCRPYAKDGDYFNTGRETFMAPVEWKDGWPTVKLGGEEVKYSYPIKAKRNNALERLSGNYIFKDEFDKKTLNVRYGFLRTVREQWYNLTDKPGALSLKLRPETCSGNRNPSFVGFRQSHMKGHAATSLHFTAVTENEKSGLLVFQNENHYYFLCKSVQDGNPVVQLYKGTGNDNASKEPELISSQAISNKELFLKVEANDGKYAFYYELEKDKWILLKDNLDGKFLSTHDGGGFVGTFYAMYASSNGKPSLNKALFNWFECRNNDDVYKK